MDRGIMRYSPQQDLEEGNMSEWFIDKSTPVSTLQYFCTLSTDEEILSTEANNTDHPNLLQQREIFHVNKHCLHDNLHVEKKDHLDFDNEVIDIALEIAALLEEQHPKIRPYISMYLMKKYFGVELNYRKFRDHIKCNLH